MKSWNNNFGQATNDFRDNFASREMVIEQFIIRELGTYNDQFYRPFEPLLDGHHLSDITNAIKSVPKSALNPGFYSRIGSGILMPSSNVTGDVCMPHGWGQKRFMFSLKVNFKLRIGSIEKYYIQGYTEHNDQSLFSNQFDPEMLFFINSVTKTVVQTVNTDMGYQEREMVTDCSHLLSDYDSRQQDLSVVRPEDIINLMSVSHLPGINGDLVDDDGYSDFAEMGITNVDYRTKLSSSVVKSKRADDSPNTFIGELTDAFVNSKATLNTISQGEMQVFHSAANKLSNSLPSNDNFLSLIKNISNNSRALNHFKLKYLDKIQPGLMDSPVTTVFKLTNHSELASRGDGQYWNERSWLTQMSVFVAQTTAAVMTKHGLSRLDYQAANTISRRDFSNQSKHTVIIPTRYSLAVNADLSNIEAALQLELEINILNVISSNHRLPYTVQVMCDVFTETRIVIQVDNGDTAEYIYPTFADSLMPPVVTNNSDTQTNIATSLGVFLTEVSDIALSRISNSGVII
jgi:hypothetical protein